MCMFVSVCACVALNLVPGTRYQSLDRGGLVDVHDREFIPIREPRDRSRDRSLERGLYLGEYIIICLSSSSSNRLAASSIDYESKLCQINQ